MARTFERIAAEGAGGFYTGELGAEIAGDLSANGSFVTADDLANYRPRSCEPVKGSYRGYEVSSNPPPGSGVTLIAMLQILEHFDLAAAGHGTARHIDLVARAMAAAHTDRNEHPADPDFADVPVAMLTSKERAGEWAEKIKAGEFLSDERRSRPPAPRISRFSMRPETPFPAPIRLGQFGRSLARGPLQQFDEAVRSISRIQQLNRGR